MTDSVATERTLVIVNDKMQRNYRYRRTEPPGKNFALEFRPRTAPQADARPGRLRRKIHDRLQGANFPRLAHTCQTVAAGQDSKAQSFRRRCLATALHLEEEELDSSRRSARRFQTTTRASIMTVDMLEHCMRRN